MTTIRVAAITDRDRLYEIDQLTRSSDNSPSPIGEASTPFFEHLAPTDMLVAVDQDVVAGYIQFRQPSPLASNSHVWQINGLAVDPRFRGRGLGRALVKATIGELDSRGGRRVTLRVLSTNPPARRLYESCGFVVEGVLKGEFILNNREIDDVLMARGVGGEED